ncbi:hypothetical protein ACFX1S_000176 [Malus domestica]
MLGVLFTDEGDNQISVKGNSLKKNRNSLEDCCFFLPASGTDGADNLGGAVVLALLLFLVRIGRVVLGRGTGSGSEVLVTAAFFLLVALIRASGVSSAPESPKDYETSAPSPASRLPASAAAP